MCVAGKSNLYVVTWVQAILPQAQWDLIEKFICSYERSCWTILNTGCPKKPENINIYH